MQKRSDAGICKAYGLQTHHTQSALKTSKIFFEFPAKSPLTSRQPTYKEVQ
jgi:hypothetical protein